MKQFPDISEYYRGDLAMKEEAAWKHAKGHDVYYNYVNSVMKRYDLKSVVEFGCATGHTAVGIAPEYEYLGVDRNEWFLAKARTRCPGRKFVAADLRAPLASEPFDLSCAFAVVKHFGLHEVDDIIKRILRAGSKYSILHMQFLDYGEDVDDHQQDGRPEYHHTFLTESRVNRVVSEAGFCEVERRHISDFDHPLGKGRNVMVLYGAVSER
jgi:SAM-dependent methyltransferase